MSDFPTYPSSFQVPGTPGSNLSETTGYYSTQSTSLPSVCSAAISPGTPDIVSIKVGMTGFGCLTSLNLKSPPSQTSTSQHSGYETDQASFDFRDSSVSSSTVNTNPYSLRPLADLSSSYSRSLYIGGGVNSSRTRMSSQSSYGGSSQLSSNVISPKSDAVTSTSRFPYGTRNMNNHHLPPSSSSSFSTAVPHTSFSVDRLETHPTPNHRRTSGDSHVTSSSSSLAGVGQHSMSSNNVYRMELGKRTNV